MPVKSKPLRLTPAGLVLVPLAVLSLVFGLITMVVIASDRIEFLGGGSLLVSGLLVYAATLVLLGSTGIANVRELESLSFTDSLTGLANRRALLRDIEQSARGDEEVALALIDLDSFKEVNDHYGHAVGDELIRQCAAALMRACGREATCYRLGGDEFAALMRGRVAGTILEGICRGLLETLASPITLDFPFGGPSEGPAARRQISVGASIGLARSAPGERLESSEMLRRADVAMSASKRGGKMRCTWFNRAFDQHREAVREIEDDLHRALLAEEFELAYQPLVSARDGRIVAVESLLRWNRTTGPVIGPNTFIPVAEESGLINPIGLWVLRQAVTDALGWDEITLSVNISAAQLRNPEFPIKLGEILEETGFPPHRLELEVTETCLVLDPVVAERTLDVIRGFGVHISLDDFGTGYASIGFLRQFRFEKLKLDRSLVVKAGEDEGSRAMMLSSIAVARALGMGVTAEGVETEPQADLARAAGCDQIQGWLYYRAMPAHEIDRLVETQNASTGITAAKGGNAA
ncbi:diguanylate cyclase/phosphodiesterase [Erythrobacter sp. HL-111]|nr:MAG: diguanylate cyclase/phosphodiesterase [Erythrobacteraceae bacterium HL-111]SDT03973.1 diguanylate cyclase/phosphodiesterase [Erythrobacter sp. HL-111]